MNEEALAELTALLVRIQNGRDDEACQELWDAVFDRVITVARKRLSSHHRRVVDEEDIALSAINSFLRAAETGRLRSYQHRDELWRVLFLITARKVLHRSTEQSAEKRGNGLVRGDSVFSTSDGINAGGIDSFPDPRHPDRFVDSLIGECRERVESLPDETLRTIALLRMEGFEVAEIAAQLDLAVATIKRKLARIRQIWSE